RRAPARAADRRPVVEVLSGSPESDARAERRASAEHPAAGVPYEAVAVDLRLDRGVPVRSRLRQIPPPSLPPPTRRRRPRPLSSPESVGPASTRQTVTRGSSVRRAAITDPAVP